MTERPADRKRLRVGINLANPLLVSGRASDGTPQGVAPALAEALASELNLRVEFVTFDSAGALAAATGWDAAFLAADPTRSTAITFSPAYVRIEARYLVHVGSPLADADEVDRPGRHIVAEHRSAYELWLATHLVHAELVPAEGAADARQRFLADPHAVLAGLAPALREQLDEPPPSRLLPGRFMSVEQAIGVPAGRADDARRVAGFIRSALASGLVRTLTEHFGVAESLSVPAS